MSKQSFEQPRGLQRELMRLSRPARQWVLAVSAEVERLRAESEEAKTNTGKEADEETGRRLNETERCAKG